MEIRYRVYHLKDFDSVAVTIQGVSPPKSSTRSASTAFRGSANRHMQYTHAIPMLYPCNTRGLK